MSYSRWSNSCWYTYYCVTYSDKRDDQIFMVCAITSFTYGELKKDLSECINKVQKMTRKIKSPAKNYTKKEFDELKGYILEFIDDIEHDVSFNEYDQVAACPEQDLPLLLSEMTTKRGKRALAHRLRGENLDTLEYSDD